MASGRLAWPAFIAVVVFLTLNANGREIASYDTQPPRLLARELVLRHTLTLDEPVRRQPQLGERQAFGLDRQGHWRSRVSIVPALPAAIVAWTLRVAGMDLEAPLAPSLVAKLTASLLVTLAAVCAWIAARRWTSPPRAALVALAFSLATGLWPTAGQTLWTHATTIAGLSAALALLARPEPPGPAAATGVGILIGIAIAARPPVAPLGLSLLAAAALRLEPRRWWLLSVAGVPVAIVLGLEAQWFGGLFAGARALEGLHAKLHDVEGSLALRPWEGLAGLLVSPSRGLLIYSPVVLVAMAGVTSAWRAGARDVRFWCLAGATLQLLAYSTYSVWWGGHTFGPRYLLDLLPALVPLSADGLSVALARTGTRRLATIALAWSLVVSATGAFCYPFEQWNNRPRNVDTQHRRLWEWRDSQVMRCWRSGVSPQNFELFAGAGRMPPP